MPAEVIAPVDFVGRKPGSGPGAVSALDTGDAVDADTEDDVKSPLSVLLDDEEALVCTLANNGQQSLRIPDQSSAHTRHPVVLCCPL